ncbi:MAG: ATP-binding protein, partial [Calditrichales bacterium]
LHSYYFERNKISPVPESIPSIGLDFYKQYRDRLIRTEKTLSIPQGSNVFHVLVPFVPKGEYAGAIYIRNKPDFAFITLEIIASYNEVTLIFAAMILLGLLAMFYISSFTVKERDEVQKLLFDESQKYLKEQIHHQKEMQFTKRIYHTHHKAEKIMGFIKEDLRTLSKDNIENVKYRVARYANFISRVIYDMKWYEPPVTSIRNQMFQTNLNEVIRFIVNNIFLRVANASEIYNFKLSLDDHLPIVNINEFVVWEILEPLIQNSIDHSATQDTVEVFIETRYDADKRTGKIVIADHGRGIPGEMLETDEDGIKKIFLENVSSKSDSPNSGFGCYIAYEIAKQRCNWDIDASNLPAAGCQISITIPYN